MTDTPNDLQRFYAAVDSLSTDIAAHKTTINNAIAHANQQSEDAKKTARRGVAVGAFGILVGIVSLVIGYNAKATADDIESSRREAIKAGCIQQNVQTDRTRAALVAGVAVVAAPTDPPRSADAQQRADEFVRTYTDQTSQKLPYRDCTDEGISSYIKNPPPDPNSKS